MSSTAQTQPENSNWMKPGSRILSIRTGALLSHEKIQKLTVQCQFRIIRFVVTDQQILFYKHESEYNIQTLQDVEDISITSQSLAKNSFKPTHIKTLQIPHESLVKVIEGLNLIVNEPPTNFRDPLLLQDIQEQANGANQNTDIPTLVLYFQSREDVRQISRAIQLSQAWIKYKEAINIYNLELDYGILDWIQENILQEDLPFHIQLKQYINEELELYVECLTLFLIHSSAINYLKFTRDYTVDQNIMQDKHLLINVKYNQVFSLIFNDCNIDYNILKNLADIICSNTCLEQLNLSHNKLTDECLPLIDKIIESCTRLNTLDLSHNYLKGKKEYFYDFIDLINLLQDDIVTDFEDFGFKLVLSHNQIGDDIVDIVEQLVLRAVRPRIVILDLSFNNISKYNLWRLYKGYLNIAKSQLQKDLEQQQQQQQQQMSQDNLSQGGQPVQSNGIGNVIEDVPPPVILNIFPLPFHPDILIDSIAIFNKMDSDTKRQEYIRFKKDQQVRKQKYSQRDRDGNIIFNNNDNAIKDLFDNPAQVAYLENRSIDISIQRLRIGNKPMPNKKAQILKIKEYRDIIISKSKDRFMTIENLLKFCTDIDELEFEFPLKLLEPLQEVTWNKLCEAMLIRDHYSISVLIKISKLVGLDLEFFEKYLEVTEARKESMTQKIEKFLNFENFSEINLNAELHYLIKECLRLDLRGPAVDQLFLIKEKRDEFIKQQIKDGFQPESDLIEQKGARGDCFRPLIMNEERKKVPKSKLISDQIKPFLYNPIYKQIFSHISRADYGLLSKLSQKTLLEYDDTIDIILSKYETNYYIDLAYRRLQYFLEDFEDLESDNPFSIFDKVFQEGLNDIKLACARLNIQYRNFQTRNIYHQNQLQQIKAPLTVRSDEIIYPVDIITYSQEYKLTNFMYLRKFDYYFTPNEIALSNLQPSDMFQHREEDTFIKPLIQFPVPEAKKDLEVAMSLLIYCIVVFSRDPDFYKKTPPKLQQLIILLNKTQFTPHLKDEVYLQIIKYSTSHDINDYVEFNILSVITALTIYSPPSDELNHFIRSFLFGYYGKQRFSKLAQDAIVALQNASVTDLVIPDWLPSIFELEQRLMGYNKFIFRIRYPNQTFQEFSLHPQITAGEFMKTVYREGNYFLQNSITDKYNYWMYQTSIYGEEEVAVMYEDILIEVMSKWDQAKFQDFNFIVKRRIYQPFHTIRLSDIHQLQINCLLDEQLRYFYSNAEYAKSIPVPSILRIAAYYLVYILKNSPKIKIDANFVFNQLKSLIPPTLKFNKEDFSIVISKMIEVEKIDNLDKYLLMFNILVQMRFHNFYGSSVFQAKINKSELEQVFVVVNAFCINIFNKQNQLKPLHSFYFEEIIYIVAISPNQAILQLFNKDSKRFSIQNINFAKPRAHEFVQDVISYSYLRIQDDNWALYAYTELFKLRYRHSLLTAPVDCGLQDVTDPFLFELNPHLNLIELGEARDKVQELNQHVLKTQFIVGEITDYPFFKETTQYSLQYQEREMRRSTYQESQLQQWFNSVLKERKQMQEEILAKQQYDQEQQRARRDRVSNYDSQNPSNLVQGDNANGPSPFTISTVINPSNTNLDSVRGGLNSKQDPFGTSQIIMKQDNLQSSGNIPKDISQQGRSSLSANNAQDSLQQIQGSSGQYKNSMGAIPEVENSNIQSMLLNQGKDNQLDIIISPTTDQKLQNAQSLQLQSTTSQQFAVNKDMAHKEPQSATLNNKPSQAEITKKLNNKINSALSIRPGAPKSQQDLSQQSDNPPSNTKPSNQQPPLPEKKNSLSSSQQQQSLQSSQKQNTQKNSPSSLPMPDPKQQGGNKPDMNTSQQLQKSSQENSEDNTLLRHSRQSSKEVLKSGSPAQSKERLKSLSRTQQTIHAQNKRTAKKSSNQNSKDNLLEGQGPNDGNISSTVTQENEQSQTSVNLPLKKPPMFMSKKKL